MTAATDDSRLGILEGRIIELSAAMQDLREGLRAINTRIDRLFLGIGVAQIALLVTLIVRSG